MSLDEIEMALMNEVMRVVKLLDAAKDPEYLQGLRRSVPSRYPAHGTRLPEVRRLARQWLKDHRGIFAGELFFYAEALWGTTWREERLFAIELIKSHKDAREQVDLDLLRRWASEADNWELIDQMAEISGRLLQVQPRLLGRIEAMAGHINPWLRRFALVTLIVAGRDDAWVGALNRMTERLSHDGDSYVKKAVTWGRDRLKKAAART